MMKTQPAALLVIFLAFLDSAAWAKPTVDTEFVPDYDYTQTRYIVFYGDDDYVVLANPFDFPTPVVGALVYKIILKYAPKLEALEAPPSQPTHTLDLIMLNRYEEWRIGQRLYLGDAWLFDGKSIALLTDEDHQQLISLLRQRYTGQERHSSQRLANLRRPQSAELPDSWLPQPKSVAEARSRMGLRGSPGTEEDPVPTEAEESRSATGSRLHEYEEPNTEGGSTSSGFTDTSTLKVPEARADKNTPIRPLNGGSADKDDDSSGFRILSVFVLIGLLLFWAIRPRTNR